MTALAVLTVAAYAIATGVWILRMTSTAPDRNERTNR